MQSLKMSIAYVREKRNAWNQVPAPVVFEMVMVLPRVVRGRKRLTSTSKHTELVTVLLFIIFLFIERNDPKRC